MRGKWLIFAAIAAASMGMMSSDAAAECPIRTGCAPVASTVNQFFQQNAAARSPVGLDVDLDKFLRAANAKAHNKKRAAPITAENFNERLKQAQPSLRNMGIAAVRHDDLSGSKIHIAPAPPKRF